MKSHRSFSKTYCSVRFVNSPQIRNSMSIVNSLLLVNSMLNYEFASTLLKHTLSSKVCELAPNCEFIVRREFGINCEFIVNYKFAINCEASAKM